MPENEGVVLVHGLWVNGMDMVLLRRRLSRAGYLTRQFRYSSLRATPRENASALQDFTASVDAPVVHLVGHSLGGIVIRHLFHDFPRQRPGRVVTLGTPHRPSSAAARLAAFLPGRILLGESVRGGLLGGLPPWPLDRQLGSIAGTLRLGMGILIPGLPAPGDGTVAVEETRFEEMTDHASVPASHSGLVLSRRAFLETEHFLRHGRFQHSDLRQPFQRHAAGC